jgi:hypothetical protein
MVRRKLWTHLRGTILTVLAHGKKYSQSADTSELYLMSGDHKKYHGMSLLFYPQREAIYLRPISELVTQTVGACLHSQMSNGEWILCSVRC